jgi:Superfamily II DNA and RNA helicases
MLDLGFLPDVERIVRLTPQQRQTMLFSATMPGDVVTLARRHMRQPTNIRAEGHDAPAPVPSTEQHVFRPTRWTRSRCWRGSCRPGTAA